MDICLPSSYFESSILQGKQTEQRTSSSEQPTATANDNKNGEQAATFHYPDDDEAERLSETADISGTFCVAKLCNRSF